MKYINNLVVNKSDFDKVRALLGMDKEVNESLEDFNRRLSEFGGCTYDENVFSAHFFFQDGTQIDIVVTSDDLGYWAAWQWYKPETSDFYDFDDEWEISEENVFNVGGNTYVCNFILEERV